MKDEGTDGANIQYEEVCKSDDDKNILFKRHVYYLFV